MCSQGHTGIYSFYITISANIWLGISHLLRFLILIPAAPACLRLPLRERDSTPRLAFKSMAGFAPIRLISPMAMAADRSTLLDCIAFILSKRSQAASTWTSSLWACLRNLAEFARCCFCSSSRSPALAWYYLHSSSIRWLYSSWVSAIFDLLTYFCLNVCCEL